MGPALKCLQEWWREKVLLKCYCGYCDYCADIDHCICPFVGVEHGELINFTKAEVKYKRTLNGNCFSRLSIVTESLKQSMPHVVCPPSVKVVLRP